MYTPHRKYKLHEGAAKHRDIPFLLTFDEWWDIWCKSGKWAQRGWRKGQYCMARFGDRGAYEVGNVRICLAEENRAERNRNYPLAGTLNPAYGKDYWATMSPIVNSHRKSQVSLQFKGKPRSPTHRAAITVVATGRRIVYRNGRRVWAYPNDHDYPRASTKGAC